jgi:enoyl-CoA hydratase/carnithine racemase
MSAMADALLLAERLNQKAPNVMSGLKDLLREATARTLPEQLALEKAQFLQNLHHPNAGKGIDAFFTKTVPDFE